jgi:hypothetical protein
LTSFRKVKQQLNSTALPEVHVDPLTVLDRAAKQQTLTLRRWKRLTVSVSALAACLAFVLLVRPDISLNDGALTVRWREPTLQPLPTPAVANDPEQLRKLELLTELVRGFAESSERSDRDREKQLQELKLRLELTQLQADNRWQDTQRDMGVLYRAQFPRKDGN